MAAWRAENAIGGPPGEACGYHDEHFGLEFGDREESSGMCDTGVGRPQTAGAVWGAGWCKAVLAENVSERPRSTGQRGVREGACCLVLAR